MLFATVGQGRLFIFMMACGAAIGAWYALTEALRRFLQAGTLLSLGCDLLFGLGGAALLIAFSLVADRGALRPFELIAAALGAALFRFAAMPPLFALGRLLQRSLRRSIAWLAEKSLIKIIFK